MEVHTMSIAQQIDTPYQVITDRILTLLEQGTVPWQQPWDHTTGLPRNLFSQRPYRGINVWRSEEHTSELQSRPHLVCRLLLEKKKNMLIQRQQMTHTHRARSGRY